MTTTTVNLELGRELIEYAERNAQREGYSSGQAYLESLLKLTILSEMATDFAFECEADTAEFRAMCEDDYGY